MSILSIRQAYYSLTTCVKFSRIKENYKNKIMNCKRKNLKKERTL